MSPMASLGIGLNNMFPSNCFPARPVKGNGNNNSGAWLIEYQRTTNDNFQAAIRTTKLRTFSSIKKDRRKLENKGNSDTKESSRNNHQLDGFHLLKYGCVDDPSDLCSVNLPSRGLESARKEDFSFFDSVAYVNVGDNNLPFEAMGEFPSLRELEMPINSLSNITVVPEKFMQVEMLDLSYNNLSENDILALGDIPRLRVLHLSSNNLSKLPPDLTDIHVNLSNDGATEIQRYRSLEILFLDDNRFSNVEVFAALAGLRRLKHLSLEGNYFTCVPQLKLVEGKQECRTIGTASSKESKKVFRATEADFANKFDSEESREKDEGCGEVFAMHRQTPINVSRDVSGKSQRSRKSAKKISEFIDEVLLERERTSQSLNDVLGTVDLSDSSEILNATPFPELRYLNLSRNQFSDEESLLPIASWPFLSTLVLCDNPLTCKKVGTPPLLKELLVDKLHIELIRYQEKPSVKLPLEIPIRKSRRMNSTVPNIPRRTIADVERLLAIEPARRTDEDENNETKLSNDSEMCFESSKDENFQTDAEKVFNFFMTQDEEEEFKLSSKDLRREIGKVPKEEEVNVKNVPSMPPSKFDILYKDDEDDVDPNWKHPPDIQATVRRLRAGLSNSRVYREPERDLDKPQPPYKPWTRAPKMAPEPIITQEAKIRAVLRGLKNRSTLVEDNMETILMMDKQTLRSTYPEATQLFNRLETKYNMKENS